MYLFIYLLVIFNDIQLSETIYYFQMDRNRKSVSLPAQRQISISYLRYSRNISAFLLGKKPELKHVISIRISLSKVSDEQNDFFPQKPRQVPRRLLPTKQVSSWLHLGNQCGELGDHPVVIMADVSIGSLGASEGRK